MAFLNPLLLFGIAAIAAPFIIHLLARRPNTRTAWAAMRFLKAAIERHQAQMKFEGRTLFLLRCALVALVALALARPAWQRRGLAKSGGSDLATILLLDDSASMAQTDGTTSRFEKAKQAAEQVLNSLPSGSAVAVWLVTDGVNTVVSEPTRDFSLVRQAIHDAVRSDRGTDWQPAIQRALDAMNAQSAAGKQLYLFTDGQAAGWKASDETAARLGGAQNVQTRIVLVGETEPRNLSVTGLRLASAFAPVGEALQFEVEVSNYGIAEIRNVEVSLAVDAEAPSDEWALDAIAPGESKKLLLSATLHNPGMHTVTARGPADRGPADDARAIAVHAFSEANVLLVDGNPGAESQESEVFYLRNALVPVPPEERAKYFIKTKSIRPEELEAQKLADFDAVVLADVADVSETTLTAFEPYLRAGGGLIVFPGPETNTAFFNAEMHAQRGFLPAEFGDARGNAGQQAQFFQLQEHGYEHPIVDPWKDAASGTLGTAHFFRAFTLVPGKPENTSDAGPPTLVMAYANGQPAVMEHTWGRGRVVQFSSTASSKWNDLCLRPAYLPLMQRVLGSLLARQDEQANGRCGTKFTFPVAADTVGSEARIWKPGASTPNVLPIVASDGHAQIEFADTDLAGGYEVRLGDDPKPFLRFATQSDPAEAKLAELSASDVKTLEAAAQVIRWNDAASFQANLHPQGAGVEFWPALAILGLVAAASETILGNRWSRPK